jgi:UDP-N-acetylmuramate dehydrogenase
MPATDIAHAYRWTSLLSSSDIVAAGTLKLTPKPVAEIEARAREVTEKRRSALPKQPNAGSIFKNPPGRFAGKLLEECCLKGRRIGGAEISPVHANVIVNLGGATAKDVKALMDEMKTAVKEKFGIDLQPEIQILG